MESERSIPATHCPAKRKHRNLTRRDPQNPRTNEKEKERKEKKRESLSIDRRSRTCSGPTSPGLSRPGCTPLKKENRRVNAVSGSRVARTRVTSDTSEGAPIVPPKGAVEHGVSKPLAFKGIAVVPETFSCNEGDPIRLSEPGPSSRRTRARRTRTEAFAVAIPSHPLPVICVMHRVVTKLPHLRARPGSEGRAALGRGRGLLFLVQLLLGELHHLGTGIPPDVGLRCRTGGEQTNVSERGSEAIRAGFGPRSGPGRCGSGGGLFGVLGEIRFNRVFGEEVIRV